MAIAMRGIRIFKRSLLIFICILLMPALAAAKCQNINFDSVEFERLAPGEWEMHVSGVTPRINMEVNLQEIDEHAGRKYARFEVVGCYPGLIGIPIPGYFSASARVNTSMARRGIELLGENQVKKMRF